MIDWQARAEAAVTSEREWSERAARAEARAEAAERKVAAGLALADEYAQSGSPYLLDRDVIVGDLRAALDTAAEDAPHD